MTQTALILLDGERPNRETLIETWDDADFRVCADGAATICLGYGLQPDLIIGDMDSLDRVDRDRFTESEILHVADQETTDGEKAILYCLGKGYRDIILLGAMGKRVDHGLYNLGLLRKFHDRLDQLRMVSDNETAFLITGEQTFRADPGTRISLLPAFGKVDNVVTSGLEYPVDHETLELGCHASISNGFTGQEATVRFDSGILLVVIERLSRT